MSIKTTFSNKLNADTDMRIQLSSVKETCKNAKVFPFHYIFVLENVVIFHRNWTMLTCNMFMVAISTRINIFKISILISNIVNINVYVIYINKNSWGSLVIFKNVKGSGDQKVWERLLQRLNIHFKMFTVCLELILCRSNVKCRNLAITQPVSQLRPSASMLWVPCVLHLLHDETSKMMLFPVIAVACVCP